MQGQIAVIRRYYQPDNGQQLGGGEPEEIEFQRRPDEVVPGVPIVRENTPRPLSFEAMIASSNVSLSENGSATIFPAHAPVAPPVPEELDQSAVALPDSISSARVTHARAAKEMQEFLWLFEYGLEMDAAILNSHERLNGLAFFYGPALLQGYHVVLGAQHIYGSIGPTIMALLPSHAITAEVWGVLYRIPRHVTENPGTDPALLDTIHAAISPQKFFKRINVMVHETFRDRDVAALTYVATDVAREQLHLVTVDQWSHDSRFLQRFVSIGRSLHLPEHYVRMYEARVQMSQLQEMRQVHTTGNSISSTHALLPDQIPDLGSHTPSLFEKKTDRQDELNTDPLPTVKDQQMHATNPIPSVLNAHSSVRTQRWLIGFSLYLVLLLLITLVFACVQGLGLIGGVLDEGFAPLGVPWLVLLYGLLGGCISSIVTLGRFRVSNPPLFIIISWFSRPFIGVVLAIMSYLLLTSGLFFWNGVIGKHMASFWLAGIMAGLAEGWIFFRRRYSDQIGQDE